MKTINDTNLMRYSQNVREITFHYFFVHVLFFALGHRDTLLCDFDFHEFKMMHEDRTLIR